MSSARRTPHQHQGPSLGRNADFVRLWLGGAVSGLGSSISGLAYPLLALSVTESAGAAGLVGLVALGAGAVMRLPAGAIVDRVPLRRVLVATDVVRLVGTGALAISLSTSHLTLWQLLAVAAVNAFAAVFNQIARSVALRRIVAAEQLPQAFALDEGRGHAISLVGQPVGGVLYGVTPVLPLAADVITFGVSAVLSAAITDPLAPMPDLSSRPSVRRDLLSGLAFLWRQPFLRATLFAAAGYQLVFGGAVFALIASLSAAGAPATSLGGLFAVAAIGGILGALVTPVLQRLPLKSTVVIMGSTAAVAFGCFGWLDQPLLDGLLLGAIFFTSAPANAVLLAAQVTCTPAPLQGRVMSASYLIAGLAAPLGPPLAGQALDRTSPTVTFAAIAVLTVVITVVIQLNRAMSARTRPAARLGDT